MNSTDPLPAATHSSINQGTAPPDVTVEAEAKTVVTPK